VAFACALQSPVQLALHFVAQSSLAGTVVHVVEQWSSQHALHDAWQSELPFDDVQLELQFEPQRDLQSVVQSVVGWHLLTQSVLHVEVHVASAATVHDDAHCCSSFAAQQASKLCSVHCVVQFCCVTK
jgi:hypothetical protein